MSDKRLAVVTAFSMLMLGLLLAGTVAAAGVACTSKNGAGTVQKDGSDGSRCSAQSQDAKSIAKTSARGSNTVGIAYAQDASRANSSARGGALGHSVAQAQAMTESTAKATASNGSNATAVSSGSGKATVTANAHGDATAEASAACKAIAGATKDGHTIASCASDDSFAKATGTKGGEAFAHTFSSCTATSRATGQFAEAMSECHQPGSVVKATATKGGDARGSDLVAPVCIPGPGTAKVRSPMGNCG